jgi:hypothetical protein
VEDEKSAVEFPDSAREVLGVHVVEELAADGERASADLDGYLV